MIEIIVEDPSVFERSVFSRARVREAQGVPGNILMADYGEGIMELSERAIVSTAQKPVEDMSDSELDFWVEQTRATGLLFIDVCEKANEGINDTVSYYGLESFVKLLSDWKVSELYINSMLTANHTPDADDDSADAQHVREMKRLDDETLKALSDAGIKIYVQTSRG